MEAAVSDGGGVPGGDPFEGYEDVASEDLAEFLNWQLQQQKDTRCSKTALCMSSPSTQCSTPRRSEEFRPSFGASSVSSTRSLSSTWSASSPSIRLGSNPTASPSVENRSVGLEPRPLGFEHRVLGLSHTAPARSAPGRLTRPIAEEDAWEEEFALRSNLDKRAVPATSSFLSGALSSRRSLASGHSQQSEQSKVGPDNPPAAVADPGSWYSALMGQLQPTV